MTLATIPDVEKVVSGYLRTHADLTALSTRVVGQTPDTTDASWVRLTQLNAQSVGDHRSERLIESYLQLDCYSSKAGYQGSQQADAARLARAVRAVLVEMPKADLDVVVTSVSIRGHARIPDQTYEPARERTVLSVVVWMHL